MRQLRTDWRPRDRRVGGKL